MIKLNADGSCSGRQGILQHKDEDGQVRDALFDGVDGRSATVFQCEHEAVLFVKLILLVGGAREEDFFYKYVDETPELPEPAHVQDAAAVLRRVMEGL